MDEPLLTVMPITLVSRGQAPANPNGQVDNAQANRIAVVVAVVIGEYLPDSVK